VATLSAASLELLAQVRAELEEAEQAEQAEQQRGKEGRRAAQQRQGGAAGGPLQGGCGPLQLEVVCKAAADCWAAGRVAGGRLLLVAMEGRGEREGGFLAASATVQALADAHFPGVFL
jgi:hypothetical protein